MAEAYTRGLPLRKRHYYMIQERNRFMFKQAAKNQLASEQKTVEGTLYKYGAAVNETVLISAANIATKSRRRIINNNDDM